MPIVQGGMLQIIDGGSRFVVQSGDALKVVSDTASSARCLGKPLLIVYQHNRGLNGIHR